MSNISWKFDLLRLPTERDLTSIKADNSSKKQLGLVPHCRSLMNSYQIVVEKQLYITVQIRTLDQLIEGFAGQDENEVFK